MTFIIFGRRSKSSAFGIRGSSGEYGWVVELRPGPTWSIIVI